MSHVKQVEALRKDRHEKERGYKSCEICRGRAVVKSDCGLERRMLLSAVCLFERARGTYQIIH